jgi:hypothetical protein
MFRPDSVYVNIGQNHGRPYYTINYILLSVPIGSREARRDRVASQLGLGNAPSSYPLVSVELLFRVTAHSA